MEEEKKESGGKRKTTNVRTAKKSKRTSFSTHTGHALTPTQAKFIDRYIETGNAKQSYLDAYGGSEKSAPQNAQKVLNKPYVSEEINYRLEKMKSESIASAEEIMQYFTDVMRGNIKDQFQMEASLGERTKAAQELAKRLIDIPNRLAGNEAPELKITLDFARPTQLENSESEESNE